MKERDKNKKFVFREEDNHVIAGAKMAGWVEKNV
jgi:hypothetical protein